jgi:integrase
MSPARCTVPRMQGHIQKRGPDTWRLHVFLGRGADGRQRFATRTVHGTRDDAEKQLARLLVEVDEGRHATSKGSVADVANRWFEAASPGWADSTRRLNRRLLDGHIIPALGDVLLRKLRPADIDRFYAQLAAKKLATATRARIDAVLRRALEQAVRWDELGVNPAAKATSRPVAKSREIDPPTPDEVRKLFAAAEETDADFAVFLRMAASAGARRGELCALRWDDIDLATGVIRITKAAEPHGAAGRTKSTKTGKRRRVGLDATTAEAVRQHHKTMAARAEKVSQPIGPWLFSSDPAGRAPWHPATVTHRFTRLARAAGIHSRLHDLRHFMATQALNDGVPVHAVQQRGGWARASTLLDTYGHWIPDTDDLAAGSIGRILDDIPKTPPNERSTPVESEVPVEEAT